jgi:TusE/DsrC/DsvC family sulfur relay protein
MTSHAETAGAPLDDEGYLIDPEQWSEPLARVIAAREGITLGDEHWEVIGFMRAHYADRQVAPDARFVMKHLAERMGHGARARARLFELFPYGYVKQACKIAGMKRPRSWSTG